VAIDNYVIVVGSENYPTGGFTSSGRAWVYQMSNGAWGLTQTLNSSHPKDNSAFGAAIDVSGNTVVVGSPGGAGDLTPGTSNDGSVYIFGRNQGGTDAWGLVTEQTPSQPTFINDFGSTLDIERNLLWVGSRDAAYLFTGNVDGLWSEADRNPPPNYTLPSNTLVFGSSAALSVRNNGSQLVALIGDKFALNSSNQRVGAAFFYFYDDGLFADSFEN